MSTGSSPTSEPSSTRTAFAFLRPLPSVRAEEDAPEARLPAVRDRWDRLFPSTTGIQETGSSLNVAGLQLGQYLIQERIGRGGMGAVFRASDLRLDRVVALKILAPEYTRDPACIQRFQNEARAAAKLDHENIARIFSSGEDGGQQYIAFEYVAGINVRDMIQQRGTLTSAETVNYILQMAESLRHTNAAGVVHRDIKPSNIIITPSGRAKLVDLGLARHRTQGEDALTVHGTTLGTFDYISPEQALDPRNVDVRSDLYSLGCTAYHMLTGEPPYGRGSMFQKVLDHHTTDAPDASAKNPLVPQALSHIIRKLMASKIEDRHQRPEDLIHDLLPLASALGVPTRTGLWAEMPPARFSWAEHRGWILALSLLALIGVIASLPPKEVEPLLPAPPTANAPRLNVAGSPPTPPASVENPPDASPVSRQQSPAGTAKPPGASSAKAPIASGKSTPSPMEPPGEQRVVRGDLPPPASAPLLANAVSTEAGTSRIPVPTGTPTPPSKVTSAPQTGESLFWVLTSGMDGANAAPKSYQTLEAACLDAPDNATIELRFDGTSPPQGPIRIEGKSLRIGAMTGHRPVLSFDAPMSVGLPLSASSQMISVVNGGLEMFDLDVVFRVPAGRAVDRWSVFSLEYAKQLMLDGVSITLDNSRRQQPSSLFELRPPSGTLMERTMREGMMHGPVQVQISNSVFRGEADGFRLAESHDASVNISHTAWAISGAFLSIDTKNSVQMAASTKPAVCQVRLDHVTAVMHGGLASVQTGEAGVATTLDFRCDNSIISVLDRQRPMISMSGPVEMDEWIERLAWKGGSNYIDVLGPWWQISAARSLSATNREFDSAEWGRYWRSTGNTPTDRNWFHSIEAWDRPIFHRIETTAFQLISDLNAPKAADGTNAGVNWKLRRVPSQLP